MYFSTKLQKNHTIQEKTPEHEKQAGHLVICHLVKIENGCCQNRHYNKILYFIIVSK